MTAEDIIQAMRAAHIGCDEDRIRREWNLNQSQATDKYIAMSMEGRLDVCDRAIQHVVCGFCGAPRGQACGIVPPFTKGLDHYAHTGRWMAYLILLGDAEEFVSDNIDDLLGGNSMTERVIVDEAKEVWEALGNKPPSDDISDLF